MKNSDSEKGFASEPLKPERLTDEDQAILREAADVLHQPDQYDAATIRLAAGLAAEFIEATLTMFKKRMH